MPSIPPAEKHLHTRPFFPSEAVDLWPVRYDAATMNDLLTLAPLILILCAGIFVQSAAGFAAGLLIVPAMLWSGYSIPEAQTSLLVATIPQNAWGVWSLRDQLRPRSLLWPGFGRLVFLPVGVFVLHAMESFSVLTLRQVVGGVVLLMTLAIAWFHPKPASTIHPFWAWIAFPASGFLQGLVGMGGPAMVFWVQAHDWDTRRMRVFLFAMYLMSLAPALLILYRVFGDRIVVPGVTAMCLIPLLLLVTLVGLKFGTWLGQQRLRRVTIGLLLLMGFAGLAAPLLSVSGGAMTTGNAAAQK